MAYFWGSTGLKYVYLHPVSPLGNRENTLIKNPQLRDIHDMYTPILHFIFCGKSQQLAFGNFDAVGTARVFFLVLGEGNIS